MPSTLVKDFEDSQKFPARTYTTDTEVKHYHAEFDSTFLTTGLQSSQVLVQPGTGKMFQIVSPVLSKFNYGTVQYTGGGNLQLNYTDISQTKICSLIQNAKMIGTVDSIIIDTPVTFGTTDCLAFEACDLEIRCHDQSYFSAGDGTVVIDFDYRIIDLNS